MKKTFVILIMTFNFYCINTSYSQKAISLSTISGGSYNLHQFSKIDVISNLADSNNLGYIPSDITNDRKYIKSYEAVTPWLQNFVNKQFVSNADKNATRLLWVIQDLSMGKDSTQKEAYSFVKLKADIYTGNELNYQLVNTFDSTWVTSNENTDFGQMVAVALIELYKNSTEQLTGIANNRFQQITQKMSGTKDDIIKQVKTSNNHPVLNATEYTGGVYMSFNEFKNNTPSVHNFYTDVINKNNEVELYQIAADSSSQLIQGAWGLSVNDELYFYSSGQLYPIEKSGNTFYIAKYLEPANRKNQAFYWRKIIGLKQGDTNPYNDAHIIKRSVSTAKNISLEATHLDFGMEDFIY